MSGIPQVNPASYIDHTLLVPDATAQQVAVLCSEALQYRFAAVCIKLPFVTAAGAALKGSGVKVATVISFPSGQGTIAQKVAEIENALSLGADEVDMVANIEAIKSADFKYLEREITECLKPLAGTGKKIKVIIESGILSDLEIRNCCSVYGNTAINFLKTSTGFAAQGATLSAVGHMRAGLPPHIGIKASGGIRSYLFAAQLIAAGATRLGCSASIQIMNEYHDKLLKIVS